MDLRVLNSGILLLPLVYRCSKLINPWTKNKIGVTNQNRGNALNIKGEQRHNTKM